MALKNEFLFADLVFTRKHFNGVHFHSIRQATSNEGESTSALIAVEQLPSPFGRWPQALRSDWTHNLERSGVLQTENQDLLMRNTYGIPGFQEFENPVFAFYS